MPIFEFFTSSLDIEKRDLYQTFNMGVGLVLIVGAAEKERLQAVVGAENCSEIGVVIKDDSNKVYLNEK
jgi:phosphoribosylformylglycinamidine cyclo-ligase